MLGVGECGFSEVRGWTAGAGGWDEGWQGRGGGGVYGGKGC